MVKSVYLAGAMKNREIIMLANELTAEGFYVFADWLTSGPDADSFLLEYTKLRGWSYKQALNSYAAKNIFEFDKNHIDRCDCLVLVMPAGKSAHIELGYARGCGKPAYILFDKEPERFDCMYQFATNVFFSKQDLFDELKALA